MCDEPERSHRELWSPWILRRNAESLLLALMTLASLMTSMLGHPRCPARAWLRFLCLVVMSACVHTAHPAQTPGDALAAYRQSVLAMDIDSTAELLEPDAQIHHADQAPVVGRAAIRKFLETFRAYHVTAYVIDAASTVVTGDTATQRGSYHQEVTGPGGEAIHADGVFEASWHRDGDGRWRIARMHTNSR